MNKLKLMTIIGTRPEIIRLSAVIKKCDTYFDQILVHTGQNYDYSLDFLDVTQTGRKTWIEVYVKSKSDTLKIKEFKTIQEHITKDLENKFDQISVEIVPAI